MPTGGLFNRRKVWLALEVLKSLDINAEFDNIINHLSAPYLTGDTNLAQFQTQLNPGGLGTEVIPASLQDELNELKFTIARIAGQTFFYQAPALTLADVNTLLQLGVGIPNNRIVSGKTVSTSTLADFLLADGATSKITLKAGGSNPNFIVVINSTQYTVSTDTNFMGMSLAPSTNNTAVVDSFLLPTSASGVGGPTAGETDVDDLGVGTTIVLNTVGSAISSQTNSFIALKNQTTSEYFIGYLGSSGLSLSNCFRGFFFNNSNVPVERANMIVGDILQIMRLTWVFVKTDLSLDVVYTNPVYSASTPTSPALGDYWFDLSNQQWKRFSGSGFVLANATLIGICIQDTVGTVGSRSFDFFAVFSDLNTVRTDFVYSNTSVGTTKAKQRVSVFGTQFDYGYGNLIWTTPVNNEAGLTIGNSQVYYLYITRTGLQVISDKKPYDRKFDLLGKYHPYNDWKAVGTVQTDGSGHFVQSYAFGAIDSPSNIDEIDGSDIRRRTLPFSKLLPRFPNHGYFGDPVISASSGNSYSNATTSFTSLGISTSLLSKGGTVLITIADDHTGNGGYIADGTTGALVRILRNGSEISRFPFIIGGAYTALNLVALDYQSVVGTNTYTVEARTFSAGGTMAIGYVIISAVEL